MVLQLSMPTPTLTPACPATSHPRSTFFGLIGRPPFRPSSTFNSLSSSPRLIRINGRLPAAAGPPTDQLSRWDFPPDFLFGVGTSAFQIEGNPTSGGRGSTIWDSFVHIPGNIIDGSVQYPGCDFYHLYEDDIKLAKDLGFDAFRFSISWTRIYPNGAGEESAEGVQYYNNVINAITRAGLIPWVTLFHWETPQYLENDPDVLGFRTKNIVPYFVKFAETCFKHFGDRVKLWVTMNEIHIFSSLGYAFGQFAPGRCSFVSGLECEAGDSRTEPYQVAHNLLLAHAKVYQLYNKKYKVDQQGRVGVNAFHNGAAPYSKKPEDILATQRYLEFISGWQLDPVVFGDYPKSMRDIVGDRLPIFTKEESDELKNSYDFFAHNYYTAYFIKNAEIPKDPNQRWFSKDKGATEEVTNIHGLQIGQHMGPSDSIFYNAPSYLPLLLEWLENRYGNIECYISENGIMDPNPYNSIEVHDDQDRITYIKGHLGYLSEAIRDKGINLKGYFHWSLIDNFEWNFGFRNRFGIVRVEFEDGKPPLRTLKSSAKWFKGFLEGYLKRT